MNARGQKKRSKSGFTLAELLVVLAILTILAGVSFVSLIRYQRQLVRIEQDQTAKEIFLAAQNRLSGEYSKGTFDRLLETDPSENSLGIQGETGDEAQGSTRYRILYNPKGENVTEGIRERLLPYGSIDETVRQEGSYIISFEADTGCVREVWYSADYRFVREDLESTALKEAGKDSKERERFSGTNGDFSGKFCQIGYYAGDSIKETKIEKKEFQPIKISVENDAALFVTLTDPNMLGTEQYDLKLSIEGVSSGASALLDVTSGGKRVAKDLMNQTYTILLDDITVEDMGFSDLNSDLTVSLDGNKKLIPGEDIKVTGYLYAKGETTPAVASETVTENSLFGAKKSDRVTVTNARHLENLDYRISGFNPNADAKALEFSTYQGEDGETRYLAIQQKDISWSGFLSRVAELHGNFDGLTKDASQISVSYVGKVDEKETKQMSAAGSLVPVEPQFDLEYEGNTFKIEDLYVSTKDSNAAGLFGTVTKKLLVQNVKLRKPDMKSEGDAAAGTLIGNGEASSEILIKKVVVQYPTVLAAGDSENAAAGGLIGNFSGTKFAVSDAAVINTFRTNMTAKETEDEELSKEEESGCLVKSEGGDAGGLAGRLNGGSISISNATASVYTEGEGYCGGLIGCAAGTEPVNIDSSYVAAHTKEGKTVINPLPTEDAFDETAGRYNIVSRASYAGGIAGCLPKESRISHSYVTASIYSQKTEMAEISEEGKEPKAGDSQMQAAFVAVYDEENGKTAADFSYCYSSAFVNGAWATAYSDSLSDFFDGETAGEKSAFPYDETLGETYPMLTVWELVGRDSSVTAEDKKNLSRFVRVHVGDWLMGRGEDPKPPVIDWTIHNGNRLWVEYEEELPENNSTYLTISVSGNLSGQTRYYVINPVKETATDGTVTWSYRYQMVTDEAGLDRTAVEQGGWCAKTNDKEQRVECSAADDGTLKIRFYIDNLGVSSGGYQALSSIWNSGNQKIFTAGEDITVGLAEGVEHPAEEGKQSVNSFFERIEPNADGTYTAYIANSRHLENLNFFDNDGSDGNKITVTRAVQTDHILWLADDGVASEKGTEAYCAELSGAYGSSFIYTGTWSPASENAFIPISNSSLSYYDGGGYTIANLSMKDTSNAAGAALFRGTTSMEVKNLKLKNPVVSADNGDAAILILSTGQLGNSAASLTLSNIEVYGDNSNVYAASYGANAGGILASANVGSFTMQKVRVHGNKNLIQKNKSGGACGGLIGSLSVSEGMTMEDCLYSGYVYGATDSHNTSGTGGLIGSLTTKDAVWNNAGDGWNIARCYVAGIKDAYQTSGGRDDDWYWYHWHRDDPSLSDLKNGNAICGASKLGGLIGSLSGALRMTQSFCNSGVYDSGSRWSWNSQGCGGLIGYVTGDQNLSLDQCYFAGKINSSEDYWGYDGRWSNCGIFIGNANNATLSFNDCSYLNTSNQSDWRLIGNRNNASSWNFAANPNDSESMKKILASGTEDTVTRTESYASSLSGKSYPYKISTKNEEEETIYYGDWTES